MPAGKYCSVTQLLSTFLLYLINKDTCGKWKVIRAKYPWVTLVEDSAVSFLVSCLPYTCTATRDRCSFSILILQDIEEGKKKGSNDSFSAMNWWCVMGQMRKNRGRNEELGHMNLMAEVEFSYHTLYNFHILNAYFYICSLYFYFQAHVERFGSMYFFQSSIPWRF